MYVVNIWMYVVNIWMHVVNICMYVVNIWMYAVNIWMYVANIWMYVVNIADVASSLPARSLQPWAISGMANGLARADLRHEPLLRKLGESIQGVEPLRWDLLPFLSLYYMYTRTHEHALAHTHAHTIISHVMNIIISYPGGTSSLYARASTPWCAAGMWRRMQ
jgi:hypothetical protein